MFLLLSGTGYSQILINEPNAGSQGSDKKEFIELYAGGAENNSPNGSSMSSYSGFNDVVYKSFDGSSIGAEITSYTDTILFNEIHYNPSSVQGSDNAFEFLELYNIASQTIQLQDFEFSEGIEHKFTIADSITGFGYLVLARDSTQILVSAL